MRCPLSIIVVFGAVTLATGRADGPKAEVDAARAGADFKSQGEYISDAKSKVAAQVIAQGNGKFTIELLNGGLPGAGWDEKSRRRFEGMETVDGVPTFDRDGMRITISRSKLSLEVGGKAEMSKADRKSATLLAAPPKGAIVLFDGKSADEWEKGQLVESNLLKMGTFSKRKFQDFTLHLEFRTPFMPTARGQDRGNSGVYLQHRYEVQILDSFGLSGEDNECGGIYKVAKPKVNMCFPPLSWQTYDMDFTAARFDASGKKTADAVLTVKHNGVVIHDQLKLPGPTAGGKPETPEPGPIFLQDHDNPVYYRNIWVVEKR